MRKSKYIRAKGEEPLPPKERFTAPGFHYPHRYADMNKEMPKWRDHEGHWRCRWCGQRCPGRRTSWCSNECSAEALIRCGTDARHQIWQRDKGICVNCGLDTEKLEKIIEEAVNRVSRVKRRGIISSCYGRNLVGVMLARWGLSHGDAGKSLWDADHILPVEEGGGACGLDGYQTLCVWCHKEKTKKQAGENAGKRTVAKREKKEESARRYRKRMGIPEPPPEPEQADLFGQ